MLTLTLMLSIYSNKGKGMMDMTYFYRLKVCQQYNGGYNIITLKLVLVLVHISVYYLYFVYCRGLHVTDLLNDLLEEIAQVNKVKDISRLTNDLHLWPDFHGNRSPVADATLRGMVCIVFCVMSFE